MVGSEAMLLLAKKVNSDIILLLRDHSGILELPKIA